MLDSQKPALFEIWAELDQYILCRITSGEEYGHGAIRVYLRCTFLEKQKKTKMGDGNIFVIVC